MEDLIKLNNVKKYINFKKHKMSKELNKIINSKLKDMIDSACSRAEKNFRNVVMEKDF